MCGRYRRRESQESTDLVNWHFIFGYLFVILSCHDTKNHWQRLVDSMGNVHSIFSPLQWLTHPDFLTRPDIEFEFFRRFEDEDDGRAEIEFAKDFTFGQGDLARTAVVACSHVPVVIRQRQGPFGAVGSERLVGVDADGTDIRRADRSHREEAVLPPSDVNGPLVQTEKTGHPFGNGWIDAEQCTREMAPEVDRPIRRRVETVIVSYKEI